MEETTMEKTNKQENETDQNVPMKQNERNDTSVSEEVFRLKQDGLSYQEIADQLGLSKSRVSRIIKAQPIPKQPNTMIEPSLSEENTSFPNEPVDFLSDSELKLEEGNLKRKNNVLRLRAKNALLTYAASNPGAYIQSQNWNGGHGSSRQDSDPAKVFADAAKSIVEAVKLGIGVGASANSGGGGFNAKDMLEFGNQREDKILAMQNNANNLAKTSVEANLFNVKMKEMELEDKQDDRKIQWEKDKYHEEKESTRQIYGLIKEGLQLVKPAIETGLTWAGTIAKNKIEKLETTTITCPKCSKDFPIIKNSPYVVCPFCQAQMGLRPPPQPNPVPEPESNPQPSEKETPKESPTPTENLKPKIVEEVM
jgi:hypothetical protein